MTTERLVKWSKKAQDFFKVMDNSSLVIDIFISYSCASQSGEGFEELVNSLNSENISRKIKKVNIIDTSFLYRHMIPKFSIYQDPKVQTEWFLINKEFITKLKCNYEVKSWANEIKTDVFSKWFKQIMIDYNGDENGDGVVREFRDLVIAEASVAAYKGKKNLKDCADFMLEECAHAVASFNGAINLVYPMKISLPVLNLAERYNLDINHLKYRASMQTQNSPDHVSIDFEGVDKEVVLFMKEKVSNVNFFVMDKYGNHIYKNCWYEQIVGNTNFSRLDPETWNISLEIMKERKQRIIEEKAPDGNEYLSVKSPLIINERVEGVIGLSIDITDRKKREEAENKLKTQEELYKIAKEVAHDIVSPISSLKIVQYGLEGKLSEEETKMMNLAIRSIEKISDKLISKYNGSNNSEKESNEEEYIELYKSLLEIVEQYRYRNKNSGIEIKYREDIKNKIVSINGEYTDFSRMMINLIKNGVEAIEEGKAGEIEVGYEVKGKEVEIRVKDNGKGMPKEMEEKIMRGEEVETTKENGHGIGMQQIRRTLKAMKGKIDIKTEDNVGTEIILTFPKSEKPNNESD